MAARRGRSEQLPGPPTGREADRPHARGVQVLATGVLLQLTGCRAPVLGCHSNEEQRPGEQHNGQGQNT